MFHIEIIFFFFIVALIYSSVGFGGGSSYLAILALYAFPFKEIRLIALVCNIIVVTGGVLIFHRSKKINWKKIIPIVIVSVPMAYWGAGLRLKQDVFFIILGFTLVIAAIFLWIKTKTIVAEASDKTNNYFRDGALGGTIGFVSGMVGIGGGIFLSPILNLLHWDTSKKIAATASVFILVNSLSGIVGQLSQWQGDVNYIQIALLGLAVFAGGQLGSRIGALKFDHTMIRRITAVLVFAAGVEVLYNHLSWFK